MRKLYIIQNSGSRQNKQSKFEMKLKSSKVRYHLFSPVLSKTKTSSVPEEKKKEEEDEEENKNNNKKTWFYIKCKPLIDILIKKSTVCCTSILAFHTWVWRLKKRHYASDVLFTPTKSNPDTIAVVSFIQTFSWVVTKHTATPFLLGKQSSILFFYNCQFCEARK